MQNYKRSSEDPNLSYRNSWLLRFDITFHAYIADDFFAGLLLECFRCLSSHGNVSFRTYPCQPAFERLCFTVRGTI